MTQKSRRKVKTFFVIIERERVHVNIKSMEILQWLQFTYL
jgi:hypothetical protein